MQYSPDGRCIASGSSDGTIRLWSAETGAPVGEPLAEGGAVDDLAYRPDGQRLCAALLGRVVEWDLASGARRVVVSTLGMPRTVGYRPDGEEVAAATQPTELAFRNGKRERPLLSAVAYSPDGAFVATLSAGGALRVRCVDTGGTFISENVGPASISYTADGTGMLVSQYGLLRLYKLTPPSTAASRGRRLLERVTKDPARKGQLVNLLLSPRRRATQVLQVLAEIFNNDPAAMSFKRDARTQLLTEVAGVPVEEVQRILGTRSPAPFGDSLMVSRVGRRVVLQGIELDARTNEREPSFADLVDRFVRGEAVGVNGRVEARESPGDLGSVGPMHNAGRSPALTALKDRRAGAFYTELLLEPAFAARLGELFNNPKAEELLSFKGAPRALEDQLASRVLRALAISDPEAYDALLERMQADVTVRGVRLREAIRNASRDDSPAKAYVPVVVIGTGPQGASFMSELKLNDPRLGVMGLEASATLGGGNFAGQGRMFRLNSTSKRTVAGQVPAFGGGIDLNPVRGPVPALGGLRYNEAEIIKRAATLSAATSGAEILPAAEVLEISDRRRLPSRTNEPGNYRLMLSDGSYLFTDRPVFFSGLGAPSFPFDDVTQQLIAQERAKIDFSKPDQVPQILTVRDGFALANRSLAGRVPYRARDGKQPVTVVVGGKNSAETFVEWLGGLGPEASSIGDGKLDYTERGDLGPVEWLTGRNGFETCEEYYRGNEKRPGRRPRYSAIEGLITPSIEGRDPKVKPVRARLESIRRVESGEDAGRLELTYTRYDAQGAEVDKVIKVADRVVLATGSTSDLDELLRPLMQEQGASLRESCEEVRAHPDGYDKVVAVGHRLKGHEVIIGAPALTIEPRSDNVTNDQVRGLAKAEENVVGLAYNTPRTVALARLIAQEVSDDPNQQTMFLVPNEPPLRTIFEPSAAGTGELQLPESNGLAFRQQDNRYDRARLRAVVRAALLNLQIEPQAAQEPVVRLGLEVAGEAPNRVIVRIAGLPELARSRLLEELQADPWFLEYVRSRAAAHPRGHLEMGFEVELAKSRYDATAVRVSIIDRDARGQAWKRFKTQLG